MGAHIDGVARTGWSRGGGYAPCRRRQDHSDRIEAGTFLVQPRSRGEVTLTDVNPEHFTAVSSKTRRCRLYGRGYGELCDPDRSRNDPPVDITASILSWLSDGHAGAMDRLDGDRFGHP